MTSLGAHVQEMTQSPTIKNKNGTPPLYTLLLQQDRHILDDIIKLLNIMDHCQKSNLNAIIMSFDFYKAFDSQLGHYYTSNRISRVWPLHVGHDSNYANIF